MNLIKTITLTFLITSLPVCAMERDSITDSGSSGHLGLIQLNQKITNVLQQLEFAQTLKKAMQIIVKEYPDYDINKFLDEDAGAYLNILRELASQQEDSRQAKTSVMAILNKNLSPLEVAFGGGGPDEVSLDKKYDKFLNLIFDPSVDFKTRSTEIFERDQGILDKISDEQSKLLDSQISVEEYLKNIEGFISQMFRILEFKDLYPYITDKILLLSADSHFGPMTIEKAQAAESLFREIVKHLKSNQETQQHELLTIVLNSYYMNIPELPLQERLRLALGLILSNPDFAHDYLDKIILSHYDLVSKTDDREKQ